MKGQISHLMLIIFKLLPVSNSFQLIPDKKGKIQKRTLTLNKTLLRTCKDKPFLSDKKV
jgi:hypothetical protein